MRLIAVAYLVLSALIGAVWGLSAPFESGPICHEDMDCWDCETMGNRRCGPLGVE